MLLEDAKKIRAAKLLEQSFEEFLTEAEEKFIDAAVNGKPLEEKELCVNTTNQDKIAHEISKRLESKRKTKTRKPRKTKKGKQCI